MAKTSDTSTLRWNRPTTESRITAELRTVRVSARCESKCGRVALVRTGETYMRNWSIFLDGVFIIETTGLGRTKLLAAACVAGDARTAGVLNGPAASYVNRLLAA